MSKKCKLNNINIAMLLKKLYNIVILERSLLVMKNKNTLKNDYTNINGINMCVGDDESGR